MTMMGRGKMATRNPILSDALRGIPARVRWAMLLLGLAGLVVVVVASLEGGQAHTIGVDKLLHFGGYATLATLFSLGARAKWVAPILLALAGVGVGVEFLQPLNARGFEIGDMIANSVGLAAGAALGLSVRGLLGVAAIASARRRKRTYEPGAIILSAGAPVQRFLVIESGEVQLSREVDGIRHELGTLGTGEVIGLVGALQSKPQYATAVASTTTSVTGMTLDELLEAAGAQAQPIETVLRAMASKLGELGDRVIEAETPR